MGLIQGFVRDGFAFTRHPLSVLANGPGGWIQTANFGITGLLVIAAAIGFARALGPKARAAALFLGGYGLAMIAASIFTADPIDGFPPGTPLGFPKSISTTGMIHFMAGALAFTCLGISGLSFSLLMWRWKIPSLGWLSLFGGLIVLLGFFGGMTRPVGIWGIWVAVVVGWAWLSFLSFRRQKRDSSDAPSRKLRASRSL